MKSDDSMGRPINFKPDQRSLFQRWAKMYQSQFEQFLFQLVFNVSSYSHFMFICETVKVERMDVKIGLF